jgi:hypothetical protein
MLRRSGRVRILMGKRVPRTTWLPREALQSTELAFAPYACCLRHLLTLLLLVPFFSQIQSEIAIELGAARGEGTWYGCVSFTPLGIS